MSTDARSNNTQHDGLTFKTWVINLFEDERERTSIKPVIALLGSLFLCGTMLVNSINSAFIPADFLVDAVMIITAIGMGADSLDKFSLRGRRSGNYSSNDYNDDSGQFTNGPYPSALPDDKIGQTSSELL
jgi:hypothetical protein